MGYLEGKSKKRTWMFKAPIAMLALVLVLIDDWLVPRVDPVGHGRLQNIGQVGIGSSLGHQSGRNATRFTLVFEQMLFKVTRMVVVAIAHMASVE